MQKYILKRLSQMNLRHTTDNYGNIYVTKGYSDLYPTMVCHIDTVHEINEHVEVHRSKDKLFAIDTNTMERYGIGGDDKVGIYITLELLDTFDVFKAVFFLDEEVGCVGSGQADFSFFDDSTVVLECDRKGINDFVSSISGTTLYSPEFSSAINHILVQYGRTETHGGMTDVLEIAYKNKVCVANMSCGYYDPHTENEYVNISDIQNTLTMCKDIFLATLHKRWEVEEDRDKSYYNYRAYDGYTYSNYYYHEDFDKPCVCPKCDSLTLYYDEYDDVNFCATCEYEEPLEIESIEEERYE